MKKFFFCFLISVCLMLTSCGSSVSRDPFSYTDAAFTLTVRGELCLEIDPSFTQGTVGKTRSGEPLAFAAEVSSSPLPAGTVMDGLPATERAYRVTVTYTAPEALAGISVVCVYGGAETATEAALTYLSPSGPLTVSRPFASVKGLLLPALALLPRGDVIEISPVTDGAWTVTCESGQDETAVYAFSKDSPFPAKIKVSGPAQRFWMCADPKG